MISVLIVDDHLMVGAALGQLLDGEDDLDVVGIAATGSEAEEMAEQVRPRLVLLDATLPDGPATDVARRLRQRVPDAGVVLVVETADDPQALDALGAGCVGVVAKTSSVDSILNGIRLAAAGHLVFSQRQLDHLLHRPSCGLTDREIEVLTMLSEGCSSGEIAERLVISRYTVRSHVQAVLKALGAHSRLEAVAVARRNGLVS